MKYGKFAKLFCIFLIIYMLSCNLFLLPAQAYSETDTQSVRVAYVLSDDFQEGAEGEQKYGYGYEYLQKIAYYTGWNYEYVYGTFAECLEMLMNGEIDLMGDVSYTEPRAQRIYYSTESQGEELFYLYTTQNHDLPDIYDPSTFEGMVVGVTAESYQQLLFLQWCQTQGVTCELVEYTDINQRIADLEAGVIDATVASDSFLSYNWVPLAQIGSAPYYFAVSRQRPDLLAQLNEAMTAIKTANPYYNDDLRSKYGIGITSVKQTLTDDEQTWLAQTDPVRIGYLSDYMPYCGTDDKTGQLDGVLSDLLENIQALYDLPYEAVAYDSYAELYQALQTDQVDTIFPVYGDYALAETAGAMVSDAVIQTTMIVFNNKSISQSEETIALTDDDPLQSKYAAVYFPDVPTISYDSIEACIDAVMNGEADFTIVETARVNESTTIIHKSDIQEADLQKPINISFAVRRGQIELLSVLNKGILCIDDAVITNALIAHSQKDLQYTTINFLRDNIILVLLTTFAVFALIVALVVAYFTLRARSQKQLWLAEQEARNVRWMAEHDILTGLLNRNAFQNISLNLRQSRKPLTLMVIDIDKFKDVNDTYGHETGDLALISLSRILSEQFLPDDIVLRYAGDEFVVILPGMTPVKFHAIADKIQHINQKLLHPTQEDIPPMSISVGVAFSSHGYEEGLFALADQALYRAKEKGRCCFST